MKKKIVTHKELCETNWYGSRNTIYKYLREEDCPSQKVKGKWFVNLAEFDRWRKKKITEQMKEKRKKKHK